MQYTPERHSTPAVSANAGSIFDELNSVDEAAAKLHGLLDELASRLDPALTPVELPKADSPHAVHPACSGLRARAVQTNEVLRGANLRVQAMLDRLEL